MRYQITIVVLVGICCGLIVACQDRTAIMSDAETRSQLSVEKAGVLAAALANRECERLYGHQPFTATSYPVQMSQGRFHWGTLDPGGEDGFSASVSFGLHGEKQRAMCFYSSDIGYVK